MASTFNLSWTRSSAANRADNSTALLVIGGADRPFANFYLICSIGRGTLEPLRGWPATPATA